MRLSAPRSTCTANLQALAVPPHLQHAVNVPALVWCIALDEGGDLGCEVWLELAVAHGQVVQQLTRQVAAGAAAREKRRQH
jgi:hypothetical protein